ncbi:hypothetical protein FNYG_08689 [Fusarium nygamai]|uniref:Uncharacterized protein n=1 Tax=Gibberella nygamai TaxID=42673 RepID=A0A2K0W6Q8_GIBNY|nr:hypothetical protein FNYG_08689 [Fusarium nygamai]
MSSYFRNREEDRNRSHGDDKVASQWGQHVDAPEWNDEAHSRFYANDRSPA